MSAFSDSLNEDLDNVFFDVEAFGDSVVLVRSGERYEMNAMYDVMALDGESLGSDISAISHRPRLSVRKCDLPNQVARKGDVFEIEEKVGFHPVLTLRAVDFASPADGVITYQLELSKRT